jgi:hypothetical protein
MSAGRLDELLAAHFRGERAITAARRFISRNIAAVVRRSDVVEFLRRRRDQLPAADIEHCAIEAMNRWNAAEERRVHSRLRKRTGRNAGAAAQ